MVTEVSDDKLIKLICTETDRYSDNREHKHIQVFTIDPEKSLAYNEKKQLLRHLQVELTDYSIAITYDISFVYEKFNINRQTGELVGNGYTKEGPRTSHSISGTCVKFNKEAPKLF